MRDALLILTQLRRDTLTTEGIARIHYMRIRYHIPPSNTSYIAIMSSRKRRPMLIKKTLGLTKNHPT
jgi:hypothetical protein